ncbi:hypothetical protein [Polynucleobacter kasalickyi]|uniref:Uncharacterized protein n=1 Tax=Polynucleobacter kasalickyi TaxID=1938817 RepID=A0A1W2BP56_9BURK|nr:hypothetical protein [Polynucleobacter kasalickyi]SMC74636.1 hypothetical protein SAMN06296008_11467 [Polynucleobacter kasalickyi]
MRNCEVGDVAVIVNAHGNTENLGKAVLIVSEYGNVIVHEQAGDTGVTLFAWEVVLISDELLSDTLQDVDRIAKQCGIVPDLYLKKFSEVVEDLGYDFDAWLSGNIPSNNEVPIEKRSSSS